MFYLPSRIRRRLSEKETAILREVICDKYSSESAFCKRFSISRAMLSRILSRTEKIGERTISKWYESLDKDLRLEGILAIYNKKDPTFHAWINLAESYYEKIGSLIYSPNVNESYLEKLVTDLKEFIESHTEKPS